MFSSHFEEEAVVLAATRWPLLSGYLLFAIEITTLASETSVFSVCFSIVPSYETPELVMLIIDFFPGLFSRDEYRFSKHLFARQTHVV